MTSYPLLAFISLIILFVLLSAYMRFKAVKAQMTAGTQPMMVI